MDKINIANIARGGIIEQSDGEIIKVLENIADKNTDWKKKRKVQVELTFQCMDESRDTVGVAIQTKSTVSPYKPIATQFYLGKDEEGKVVVEEFIKGQMKGQVVVDTNTGEILSEEKETRKIVNINR